MKLIVTKYFNGNLKNYVMCGVKYCKLTGDYANEMSYYDEKGKLFGRDILKKRHERQTFSPVKTIVLGDKVIYNDNNSEKFKRMIAWK